MNKFSEFGVHDAQTRSISVSAFGSLIPTANKPIKNYSSETAKCISILIRYIAFLCSAKDPPCRAIRSFNSYEELLRSHLLVEFSR